MIVDFAVERDHGAAGNVPDGLVAALKVENLQARRAQRSLSRLKDALLVGAAMNQRSYGVLNAAWRRGAPVMGESRNSTHRLRFEPAAALPLEWSAALPPERSRGCAQLALSDAATALGARS